MKRRKATTPHTTQRRNLLPTPHAPFQAQWRQNPQETLDFITAARGPDIVAIEQDKSTSFILDTSPPPARSSRLARPLKSLASIAPHPEAAAAAKIFSAGKRACACCC